MDGLGGGDYDLAAWENPISYFMGFGLRFEVCGLEF